MEEYEGSDAVEASRLVGLDRRGVLWTSEGRRGPGTSASRRRERAMLEPSRPISVKEPVVDQLPPPPEDKDNPSSGFKENSPLWSSPIATDCWSPATAAPSRSRPVEGEREACSLSRMRWMAEGGPEGGGPAFEDITKTTINRRCAKVWLATSETTNERQDKTKKKATSRSAGWWTIDPPAKRRGAVCPLLGSRR